VTRALRRRAALFALAAGLWLGCPVALAPEDATEARRAIVAWLECEECWGGELGAVAALGDDAVPLLAATLDAGLSPASRAKLEAQLGAYYDQAEKRGAAALRWSRKDFVAHHLATRDAGYRSRAAEALGRIGGRDAESALRDALAKPQRPSVEQSIREALARL